MQVGGIREITIPPSEGYGAFGNAAAGIGPTDDIIFYVTLNSIDS